MRLVFGFLLFFTFCISRAQEIVILDKESLQPIFNVAVFNKDKSKSSLSNFDGEVDLSQFSSGEIIFFRHVSHLEFHATKGQILKNNNRVLMEPGQHQLNEVVLSVSRFDQQKRELPQKVISFNQKEIIASSPQTSADLLENTGGIFVQKSQLGGGSPMIRGFATNRLLITVDGVRMNTAIFRGGNVQNVISIDPLAIEKTEVILGPGSVIYGSDAVGGVMNFFTLSPGFSMTKGGSFDGKAYVRHATANEEKTGHFHFSFGKKKWAALSSVTYSDFGDLQMGSEGPSEYLRHEYVVRRDGRDIMVTNENPEIQVPTGYQQLNLLQKFRFKPSEIWDISLSAIYSTTSDFPRYDRLYRKKNGILRAAEWYYGPQNWLQTNFKIEKLGVSPFYDEAKFTAAYQIFEESRNDRDFEAEILYETDEQVHAWSANLDFEKDLGKNQLFYGLEYVLNEVNSQGEETNILSGEKQSGSSRYPDGSTWTSMAAYANIMWKLGSQWNLQTGARYNHVLLKASFDDEIYDFPFSNADLDVGALTGNAGLNWQQTQHLSWQFNLSSAFRAPNIDDVGKIFDSAPGFVVVPNPNLKPETAYNAEVGLRLDFDKVAQFEISAYYTHLENALVRRDYMLDGQTHLDYQGEESRVQAIQNTAKAQVYGFEAGGKIYFSKNLKLSSQVSLTEGEEEQEDGSSAALRHAAPFFGNAHLIWQNEYLRLDLFAEYNSEISYADLAPSEQDKAYMYAIDSEGNPYSPEWYTLNFNSQYQFSEAFLVTAGVENITDQRYRTYSSGIAAAGRNFILALQYSF